MFVTFYHQYYEYCGAVSKGVVRIAFVDSGTHARLNNKTKDTDTEVCASIQVTREPPPMER